MQKLDKPIVLDNVIPTSLFDKIQSIIMSPEFPWYFIPSTALEYTDRGIMDYSFWHPSFIDGEARSVYNDIFHDGILTAMDRFEIRHTEYYRTRLGLSVAQETPHIHTPHVDLHYQHHTMLLYVNDSDGDTTLYDYFGYKTLLDTHDAYEVMQTVTPKANRAVLFRGDQFHSSQVPVENASRVIINSNFRIGGYKYD